MSVIDASGAGFGVYVHVPFCARARCPYCDFYSLVGAEGMIPAYLAAVERELEAARRGEFAGAGPVRSVFFGGGTPSLLEPAQVGQLVERVDNAWGLAPDAELTLEANPEHLEPERLAGYRDAGVNRLSVGCQSFGEHALAALGRRHGVQHCRTGLTLARAAGFERLSADLIFGGPGTDEEVFLASLAEALALGVEHLSLYGYHLEEGCPALGRPEYAPAGEESYRGQYLAACGRLEALGWRHYEISNWARDNQALGRHNLLYWRRERAYLGLGPSAHSFLPPDRRWWNRADLAVYLKEAGQAESAFREAERLTPDQQLEESLLLALRLDSGVERALVGRLLGAAAATVALAELERRGLVRPVGQDRLALTDQGFLLYDSVVEFLVPGAEL